MIRTSVFSLKKKGEPIVYRQLLAVPACSLSFRRQILYKRLITKPNTHNQLNIQTLPKEDNTIGTG